MRSGWVLPILRGRWCPRTRSGAGLASCQECSLPLVTHYRRKRINHRFRRPSLTKPHQKFTCVHPSDLPLARLARMVRVCLGHHPSAFVCFVTWHLQGSGTNLDTGWDVATSHIHSSRCYFASRFLAGVIRQAQRIRLGSPGNRSMLRSDVTDARNAPALATPTTRNLS